MASHEIPYPYLYAKSKDPNQLCAAMVISFFSATGPGFELKGLPSECITHSRFPLTKPRLKLNNGCACIGVGWIQDYLLLFLKTGKCTDNDWELSKRTKYENMSTCYRGSCTLFQDRPRIQSTTTMVHMILRRSSGSGPSVFRTRKQNNGTRMACLEQISATALCAMNEMTTKSSSNEITGTRTILSPTLNHHQGRKPK